MNPENQMKIWKVACILALATTLSSCVTTPAVQKAETTITTQIGMDQTRFLELHEKKKETVTLKNTEGKNTSDVAAIKEILEQQAAQGLDVTNLGESGDGTDMNNFFCYEWKDKGRLERIDWNSCGLKGELSLGKLTELNLLSCMDNSLTGLDVCENKKLTHLCCSENSLVSLDISRNKKLTYLECGKNLLTALDVSRNKRLTYLGCAGNSLTKLDIGKCTKLGELNCSGNQIATLDVRNCQLYHGDYFMADKNVKVTGLKKDNRRKR